MATKKEPVKDSTQKQIDNLAATLRKVITSLEKIFGIDIDRDGKVGRASLGILGLVFLFSLVVAAFAAEDTVWRAFAQEGNDAVLTIEADEGDDAADEAQLIMQSDGDFVVSVGGTDIMTLNTTDQAGTATATVSTVTSATTIGPINKTVLTLADHPIVIDGSSGAGWGATQLCTVVQGYIDILMVKGDDVSLTGDAGDLAATGAGGDYSLGTTATADNSLATTEIDLLPSTGVDPLQTGVDSVLVAEHVPIDGTAAGTAIYMNWIIDDADVTGASTNLIDGAVTFWWIYAGDN